MTWVAEPGSERIKLHSIPLFRVNAMHFRLHWIFLAYALVVMVRSAVGTGSQGEGANPPAGPVIALLALGSLLVLVLIREVTRACVVRMCGGTADEVELWPMGTLRGIQPAPRWRAGLVSAAAGLCASAVIFAILAVPLGLATGGEWLGAAVPNPIDDSWLRNPHPQWLDALWILQRTGLQLALLNLIPMLPLDGGLAMQALVTRARGPHEAPRGAASLSAVVAAVTAGVAIVAPLPEKGTLLAVAAACFVEAVLMLQRVRIGDAIQSASGWTGARDESEAKPVEREGREAIRERRQSERREQAEADEGREVDRILDKIATKGIDSLSATERDVLRQATEKRRRGRTDPRH